MEGDRPPVTADGPRHHQHYLEMRVSNFLIVRMRAQWTAIMRLWQGPCPLARPNHEAMHIKRRVPVGKEDMRLDGREKAEDCGCRECQH